MFNEWAGSKTDPPTYFIATSGIVKSARKTRYFEVWLLSAAFILFEAVLMAFTMRGPVFASEWFMPSWEAGKLWRVRAHYGTWNSSETRSGAGQPTVLTYVVEEKQGNVESFWVVRVTGEKNGRAVTASLRYREKDFSLAEAEMESVFLSKKIREDLSFPMGKPVISKYSDIPLDQPVFPIEVPSRKSYEIEREIGDGLKVREKVTQVVRNLPGEKTGTAFEVTCEDDEGRMIFRQVWEKGKPWAVKSWSEGLRYELVKP